MAETQVKAPGTFCWAEVATSDVAQAKEFYAGLFDWEVKDMESSGDGAYTMMRLGGKDAAGLYALQPAQLEHNIPPHWMSYVLVEDCDASTAKVTELGGNVLMGPMDVMDLGRMTVIQDPTGAILSIWQAKQTGDSAMGLPGAPCWFELISTDKTEATAFYAGLFDWKLEEWGEAGEYTLFKNGEASVAGAMQRTPEMGEIPSHWMIYMAVEDCDASAKRAEELGGKVVHGPMDIPQVGRFALLADPLGAMFSIIKLQA